MLYSTSSVNWWSFQFDVDGLLYSSYKPSAFRVWTLLSLVLQELSLLCCAMCLWCGCFVSLMYKSVHSSLHWTAANTLLCLCLGVLNEQASASVWCWFEMYRDAVLVENPPEFVRYSRDLWKEDVVLFVVLSFCVCCVVLLLDLFIDLMKASLDNCRFWEPWLWSAWCRVLITSSLCSTGCWQRETDNIDLCVYVCVSCKLQCYYLSS